MGAADKARLRRRREELLAGGCHYCPAPAVTIDHIVPKSLGGRNALWNYVGACAHCNTMKGQRLPDCGCLRCREALRKHVHLGILKTVDRDAA